MRLVPKLLAAAMIAALATMPAAAQDDIAQREEIAAEIIALSMTDMLVGQTGDAVWPIVEMDLSAGGVTLTPAELADLREAFDITLARMIDNVSGSIVDFYAREFTLDELVGLRDFYLSPAGVRLLEVTPQLTAEVMPAMMTEAQRLLPEVLEMIQARARTDVEGEVPPIAKPAPGE